MTQTLKQNDSAPNFISTLTLSGSNVDLTSASEVRFRVFDKYEKMVLEENTSQDVSIEDEKLGRVSFDVNTDDFPNAGEYKVEWVVDFSDGERISFPNTGYRKITVVE